MQINYKQKYQELKLKYKNTVDLAFRLGVEEGLRQGQVQEAQSAQAAAAAQPGQSGEDPNAAHGQDMNNPASPDGSELDGHINTLESMLSSAKPGSVEKESLEKSLKEIKAFQLNLKMVSDLKKSEKAIAEIGKALNKKSVFNNAATKNLSVPANKALNSQEQIIQDLMKSFDDEQKKANEAISKTLTFEQILKD